MNEPSQPFDPRHTVSPGSAAQAFPEPQTERWPLAARASLVMSLCGLFWGVLGAAVLHLASR